MTRIIDLGINVVEGREFLLCETCPEPSVGSCEEPSKDDGGDGKKKDPGGPKKVFDDLAVVQLKQQLRSQIEYRV